MNKTELIEKVAESSGLTHEQAEKSVNAILKTITDAISADESVSLVGFGTFTVRERAARSGRSPKTGETINIQAAKVPAFKAGKALKLSVQGGDEGGGTGGGGPGITEDE